MGILCSIQSNFLFAPDLSSRESLGTYSLVRSSAQFPLQKSKETGLLSLPRDRQELRSWLVCSQSDPPGRWWQKVVTPITQQQQQQHEELVVLQSSGLSLPPAASQFLVIQALCNSVHLYILPTLPATKIPNWHKTEHCAQRGAAYLYEIFTIT